MRHIKLRVWHFLLVGACLLFLIGYGLRGVVESEHNIKPAPAPVTKQPINITIWVPDRDIKYSPGTLPGMKPAWKVAMKGKL